MEHIKDHFNVIERKKKDQIIIVFIKNVNPMIYKECKSNINIKIKKNT